MINQILDQVLANTFIQSQALHRLNVLKDLCLVRIFQGTDKKNPLPPHSNTQSISWITTLNPQIFENFNRENVYKLFDELEQMIKKITPLTIYLPAELPETAVAAIGAKLRLSYGKNFLMEIKINPSLLAGCALTWKGIYKDYSLKQKIQENKETILKMMRA